MEYDIAVQFTGSEPNNAQLEQGFEWSAVGRMKVHEAVGLSRPDVKTITKLSAIRKKEHNCTSVGMGPTI